MKLIPQRRPAACSCAGKCRRCHPSPGGRRVYPQIRAVRRLARAGAIVGEGMCLREVREAYGIPALHPSASAAWAAAKRRHPTTDPTAIPRGAAVFWTGGSAGHGHIAISAGGGWCWTTDLPHAGRWGRVRIADVAKLWPNVRLVGWSEDVNGCPAGPIKGVS